MEVKKYDLDPTKIYEILVGKECNTLYHANTVLTSRTYFEEGSLLSREQVKLRGLEQTDQYTDATDIKYGINNDIYMDVVDIHSRMLAKNDYGPVLFTFPLTLLKDYLFKYIRITKMNPSSWTDADTDEQRYYTSEEEFERGYHKGNFSSMLMFHHINGEIKLKDTLQKFIIDNPKLAWKDQNNAIATEAVTQFGLAKKKSGMGDVKYKLRNCPKHCACHKQYGEMAGSQIEKHFKVMPRII